MKIAFPSLFDEIYHQIIPLYREKAGQGCNPQAHFRKFFQYYLDASGLEAEKLVEAIKPLAFLEYTSAGNATVQSGVAGQLYFPDRELVQWFAAKPSAKFARWDELLNLAGQSQRDRLRRFLRELGVAEAPRLCDRELDRQTARTIKPYSAWAYSSRQWIEKWYERYLDGCRENIEAISAGSDAAHNERRSLAVWDHLLAVVREHCKPWKGLERVLGGEHRYFYWSERTEYFDSRDVSALRTAPWLMSADGHFTCARDLTRQNLSPLYQAEAEGSELLLQFLGVKADAPAADAAADSLAAAEQAARRRLERLKEAGYSEAEIDAELETLIRKKQRPSERSTAGDPPGADADADADDWGDAGSAASPAEAAVRRLAREAARRAARPKAAEEPDGFAGEEPPPKDEDDYTKPSVDYTQKIEQAKKQLDSDLRQLAQEEELVNRALSATPYTWGWFKALLDLEIRASGENNAGSREISISFARVEHEPGTARTLLLKHPSRYIPQWMEDLADIPLVLRTETETRRVAIEGVSVKSYTLRAKLRTNADLSGIDLAQVYEARIDAQNPAFLLKALQEQLNNLKLPDDYNLQDHLAANIEFVFGPPGTGKTTHLAREVLIPLMQRPEDLRVLVLTPTNKAADVVTRRIIELMAEDTSYTDWLVRFGSATDDTAIEGSGVYRDKTFDIRSLAQSVTVTTMARFPYDYFMPPGARLPLCDLKWDYIVIDEASMIPLIQIILPLYMKTPEKFVIAGDPFQIQPITAEKRWKDENIYTMVGLDSFTHPATRPHPYPVTLLTTQYRSIPAIGEVFSRLTYGGVLRHHRPAASRTPLGIEAAIPIAPLTVIKFPVSRYESIYRLKRLQHKSSYQVYSALFAFEFVRHMVRLMEGIRKQGPAFRIGIIAPYRAQADVIDKLISRVALPKGVEVQVDTIHGFQGDECDLILAVFNPPPGIPASPEMFLNKQNIINVSVSRARDYLIVVMPDEATENVANLTLVNRVGQLCREQSEYAELHTRDLEWLLFRQENFIEENAFSTSHQLVNVYGEPERRYEIRSEESAVDVQIHEDEGVPLLAALPEAAATLAAEATASMNPVPADTSQKN